MTLYRIVTTAAILVMTAVMTAVWAAPARAAEDVAMGNAFAAAFGERGTARWSAERPEHPPGCDCAGAAETVTLDVRPQALLSRDGRRYVLVASERDLHASHADPGAIAIAYVERTTQGWRTERVWREIAWSGSDGDPADRVASLPFHEPAIAIVRGGAGQGRFATTGWIIAIGDDGPRLLGHVPIGGFLRADSCPSCSRYAYQGAIGPPTHAGAALSVAYGGWTSPPGQSNPKTPFAVVVDYDAVGGTLKPERDPRLPDGISTQAPGDASAEARAMARLPPATPRAFADQLVALYGTHARTAEAGRLWDRWEDSLYDPDLRRLIDDNRQLESRPGGDLFLDHDPICGCQADPAYARVLSITGRPNGLAQVTAAYCSHAALRGRVTQDACNSVDLVIKRIGGAWRLYDVGPGSLRESLARENDRLRGEAITPENR